MIFFAQASTGFWTLFRQLLFKSKLQSEYILVEVSFYIWNTDLIFQSTIGCNIKLSVGRKFAEKYISEAECRT